MPEQRQESLGEEALNSEISEKLEGFGFLFVRSVCWLDLFGFASLYNMQILNSSGNCHSLGSILALQSHLLRGFFYLLAVWNKVTD